MSALHLFGRRWHLGADDVFVPAACSTVINIPLLIITAVVYAAIKNEPQCENNLNAQLEAFRLGFLILQSCATALDLIAMLLATRTKVFQLNVPLQYGLYARSLVSTCFLVFCVAGAVFFANVEAKECLEAHQRIASLSLAMLVISWIACFLALAFVACVYNGTHGFESAEDAWRYRLSYLTCACCWRKRSRGIGSNPELFGDVARYVSTAFHADMEGLVMSDIVLGLLLVKAMQIEAVQGGEKRFYIAARDYDVDFTAQSRAGKATRGAIVERDPDDAKASADHVIRSSEVTVDIAPSDQAGAGAGLSARSGYSDNAAAGDGIANGDRSNGARLPSLPSPRAPLLSGNAVLSEHAPTRNHAESDVAFLSSQGKQPVLKQADWDRIEESRYFSRFAVGAYGWPLHTLADPLQVLTCQLCGPCLELHADTRYVGRSCFNCSVKAFLKRTGIPTEDLLYCSLDTDVGAVVHYICVDRRKRTLVVAARGTMSVQDVITDLDVRIVPLDDYGWPGHYTHSGILRVADALVKDFSKSDVIQRFLSANPDYGLVVCGHSLGAGAATLVSLLLLKAYPRLRCFTYGSPMVVDEALARHPLVQQAITSVVYNKDIIPRLSMSAIHAIKQQMKEGFARMAIDSKFKVTDCHLSFNSLSAVVGFHHSLC